MNSDIPKDILARLEQATLEHKHLIGNKSNESFRMGASALWRILSEQAWEFDEQRADNECIDEMEHPTPQDRQMYCDGARWQHAQMSAQLAEAKASKDRWFNEHQKVLDVKNELLNRVAELEQIISYLPKVPTEPYEKGMAKRIAELEQQLAEATQANPWAEALTRQRALLERYRAALDEIEKTRCAWQLSQAIAREALKEDK